MKRLSKNATIVFRYLYKSADHTFTITEIYHRLGLLSGDEKDVVKELSGLGLFTRKVTQERIPCTGSANTANKFMYPDSRRSS
jgi:DNA-binding MarR family transcriptional regulator